VTLKVKQSAWGESARCQRGPAHVTTFRGGSVQPFADQAAATLAKARAPSKQPLKLSLLQCECFAWSITASITRQHIRKNLMGMPFTAH